MEPTHPPAAPPWERHLHLTNEQRNALHAIMDARGKHDRPTPEEYLQHEKDLLRIPVAPFPKAVRGGSRFPNTEPGFNAGEVKPGPSFDAKRDLPAGWGLYPRYDSGGNFKPLNAADIAWTAIWNNWRFHKGQREEALKAAEQAGPEMGM